MLANPSQHSTLYDFPKLVLCFSHRWAAYTIRYTGGRSLYTYFVDVNVALLVHVWPNLLNYSIVDVNLPDTSSYALLYFPF